jgi:AraC-like DNA-binding protein
MYFVDAQGRRLHLDLSRYDSLRFTIRCKPANTLALFVPTFDSRVSRRDDFVSYRTPVAHFSCHERGSQVNIDLTRLETPEWWYSMVKLDLSQKDYKLNQVPKIAIGTTFQSPKMVASMMEIADLRLEGRDQRYLYLLGVLLACAWSGFALWFFRSHARALEADVHDRLRKDRPLVAYQQLTLAPHRDREKSGVLACLAERFADPDIELEAVAGHTGVNRNKINDILKTEFGLTFTGYLNKLRLTEAARLLSAKDTATVAEIAHAVGYNNVSYFNKLFKTEYGCTPKAFRDACTDEG